MADIVPAAEFARNLGRCKMQAQREAVPVSSNGVLAGYFVAPHDYEALQKLKGLRRRFQTAELSDEEAERIASSRMDARHDHLTTLLDPKSRARRRFRRPNPAWAFPAPTFGMTKRKADRRKAARIAAV
jgi:hypothetical protein